MDLKNALFGEGGLLRVRAILAYSLVGGCIYLWVTGDNVPDAMLGTTGAVTAYYFASRQAQQK